MSLSIALNALFHLPKNSFFFFFVLKLRLILVVIPFSSSSSFFVQLYLHKFQFYAKRGPKGLQRSNLRRQVCKNTYSNRRWSLLIENSSKLNPILKCRENLATKLVSLEDHKRVDSLLTQLFLIKSTRQLVSHHAKSSKGLTSSMNNETSEFRTTIAHEHGAAKLETHPQNLSLQIILFYININYICIYVTKSEW